MAITHGADVDQLRQLADTFDRQANELDSSNAVVSGSVQSSAWFGPIAVLFKTTWTRDYSVQLRQIVTTLRTEAKVMRAQAQQQDDASTGGSAFSVNVATAVAAAVTEVVEPVEQVTQTAPDALGQTTTQQTSQVDPRDIHSSNRSLSTDEMQTNAQYILDYLRARGWSKEAVCALLGNMQAESSINPGRWEVGGGGGYGLVQWTPASKYLNWAKANGYPEGDMNGELECIIHEFGSNNGQFSPSSHSGMTAGQFMTSTESPAALADVFLHNYERPADASSSVEQLRASYAMQWYDALT